MLQWEKRLKEMKKKLKKGKNNPPAKDSLIPIKKETKRI